MFVTKFLDAMEREIEERIARGCYVTDEHKEEFREECAEIIVKRLFRLAGFGTGTVEQDDWS